MRINSKTTPLWIASLLWLALSGAGCRGEAKTEPNVGPTLDVWYGLDQTVGHLGTAQHDFNLLGNVADDDGVDEFTYRVNGGAARWLAFGDRPDGFGDGRRLAATGDFNADIPMDELQMGQNAIELEATDRLGALTTQTVTVERRTGSYPTDVHLDWDRISNPQDVGQYVDGKWAVTSGGLRTLHPGYDRLFLIGDTTWQNYEVTVPVTIHDVERELGPFSGASNAVGLLMRFTGHVVGGPRAWPDVPPQLGPRAPGLFGWLRWNARVVRYVVRYGRWPAAQPKWGYQPYGGIGWLSWTRGPERAPMMQFSYGNSTQVVNADTVSIEVGRTYWMKMQCETWPERSNVTRYSWKIWDEGQEEPPAWNWVVTQSDRQALRQGGVGLVAHHVDATFGDITVRSLSEQKGDAILDTLVSASGDVAQTYADKN